MTRRWPDQGQHCMPALTAAPKRIGRTEQPQTVLRQTRRVLAKSVRREESPSEECEERGES